MEFALDEAQLGLQETVARFCADRFSFDTIAAREGVALDRRSWSELAELGVFSLLVPEAAGAPGLGPVEAAIVFEQFGDHVVPGPMLWTVLAASLVDGASDGSLVVGGVEASDVVDGSAAVANGADLDALLVVHDDHVVLHRTADLPSAAALDPLDPLTPVARLSGLSDGTGEVVGDADVARSIGHLGTVLVASMLSGVAGRSLEVARTYALERQQFDAPIGSFQAVKHLLADMYVRTGLAQASAYAAAAVLADPGDDDPGDAAASAKVVAVDAAITNASDSVQILGGMGFTWDMLPNHLLKRAWVLEHTFGTADDHALRLGSTLVEHA